MSRASTPPSNPGAASPRQTDGAESTRPELIGLSPERTRARIADFLTEAREPSYRVGQIEEWIYGHGARTFEEMTPLPGQLREALDARFSLTPMQTAYEARSRDGTVKHLWRLEDGEQVESVLIPSRERVTLCLSSQVGCALACRFCATGYFGFRRQLRASEIVAQYRDAARFVASGASSRPGSGKAWPGRARRISNVVYMGMGEPLANLDPVLDSLDALHRGFGLGARRITVSTVGLVPGILELARRPEPFDLAVSLHAPLHDLRLELMPIEQRYPLPALFDALREYQSHKNRRISFEYTLIDGVNDDPALADALADLTFGLTCFVNLIPFNPIPDLEQRGVGNAVRTPRGRDIAAACGQLRLARLAAET